MVESVVLLGYLGDTILKILQFTKICIRKRSDNETCFRAEKLRYKTTSQFKGLTILTGKHCVFYNRDF